MIGTNSNIEEKLDQLITLMAVQAVSGIETMNEKILFLNKIGIDRHQIAVACGTTPATVSVRLSEAKKEKKK